MDSLPERERIPIGRWPTPVRPLERTSSLLGVEVWAKLEDDCGAWGGNKVRKLEVILAKARALDSPRLVSYGAGTSNWTPALALHGRAAGFDVTVGLAGHVPAEYAALYRRTGTRVVGTARPEWLVAAALAARMSAGRNALRIAAGGSGWGDLGSAGAGTELADQVDEGALPRPEAAFVAAGTGGTAGGLAAGLGARGLHVPVVAVRVTALPYGTVGLVRRHAVGTRTELVERGLSERRTTAAPVAGDDRLFKPGYGRSNAASEEAIRIAELDGIVLDPTYGAKAFASLLSHARAGRRGPLVFLHTSPGPVPIVPEESG